jgi:hypothetical protein
MQENTSIKKDINNKMGASNNKTIAIDSRVHSNSRDYRDSWSLTNIINSKVNSSTIDIWNIRRRQQEQGNQNMWKDN